MPKRRPSLDADVGILGAASAGLGAAQMLVEAGLRVMVFEARKRIGGKVFTRYTQGRAVELGGELIHGQKSVTHELVKQYNLTLESFPARGCTSVEGVLRRDRKLEKPSVNVVEEMRTLAANLRREGRGAMTVEEMLVLPAAGALIDGYRGVTAQFVRQLVSNDFAADPATLTLEAFLAPDVTGYDANFRIKEGYSELFKRMAKGIDVRLGTPVTGIDWDDGYARLFTKKGQFVCRNAIITAPIGVLQNETIRFHPDLPRRTWSAINAIDPGIASKSVLSFHPNFKGYPFWPADMGMVASDRRSQLWWETQPFRGPRSEYMLTNLTAGSESARLAEMAPEEREDHLLSQLEFIFSKKKKLVRRCFLELFDERHWAKDPWARGAYSSGPTDASLELTRRVGPLRFAGEAVGTREPGNVASVHGAIMSGRYAAMKILEDRR